VSVIALIAVPQVSLHYPMVITNAEAQIAVKNLAQKSYNNIKFALKYFTKK